MTVRCCVCHHTRDEEGHWTDETYEGPEVSDTYCPVHHQEIMREIEMLKKAA